MKTLVGITFGLFLSLPSAAGSIYRWMDDQGQVHFGDKPPVGVQPRLEEVTLSTGNDPAAGGGIRNKIQVVADSPDRSTRTSAYSQ